MNLAHNVIVARFLEVGGDHFLGVGLGGGTRVAQLFGGPEAQEACCGGLSP
jgi:hypothetical protein